MPSRREFLSTTAKALPLAGAVAVAWDRVDQLAESAPRARYWLAASAPGADCRTCHDKVPAGPARHDPTLVKCLLCAQGCALTAGQRGKCRARLNVRGELRSLVYGRPIATQVDPIEKKPFYHFLPGSQAFSLATAGCPLRCKFCQNWQLSQASPEDYDVPYMSPDQIATAAATRRAPVVAFTYNEPTVFTEYLLDIAAAARTRGLRSVMISCGFMNEAPLADMCRALDAIKIDLKGFSETFYRDVSSAALAPVLRSIAQIAKSGVHLEIVNLVVPTLNDAEPMMDGLASWVLREAGPDVPIHFTRFHPDYQLLNLPPTPVRTLERAREIAMAKGLRYVYVGNVPDHPGNHTYCPACRAIVIRRQNFFVDELHVKDGRCEYCRAPIAGVWT